MNGATMTKLIKLPGARELEDCLIMDRHAGDTELRQFKSRCAEFLETTFGITERDTRYFAPSSYFDGTMPKDQRDQVDDELAENEAQYQTEEIKWDEERVEYLKTLGWDLTDYKGVPLNITRYVCRVIEAVAKGIAGRMPDADIINAKEWEKALTKDAQRFVSERKPKAGR